METFQNRFLEKLSELESQMGEPIDICGLTGPLRLFQRRNGHKQSIDDTVTAWYALKSCPHAKEVLDLGSGVGTVGLIVLWGLGQEAKLTCVEAQEKSHQLLIANIQCNELEKRAVAILKDLRELNLEKKFLLISASPPYFPANAGTIPQDEQKAYARFELRGHVGDYARCAKRHLQEDGWFVFCFPHAQKQRGIDLVEQEGFSIASCKDVIPTMNSKPLFSVFAAGLKECAKLIEEPPLIVQGPDGKYSEEMLAIQQSRGFGPEGTNSIRLGSR